MYRIPALASQHTALRSTYLTLLHPNNSSSHLFAVSSYDSCYLGFSSWCFHKEKADTLCYCIQKEVKDYDISLDLFYFQEYLLLILLIVSVEEPNQLLYCALIMARVMKAQHALMLYNKYNVLMHYYCYIQYTIIIYPLPGNIIHWG